MLESIKSMFSGRSERRRVKRELDKALNPEEKAYIEMVEANSEVINKRLMEFRDELVDLGYQVVPTLRITERGIIPDIQLQPLTYPMYLKHKELKNVAKGNIESATKEEDKTIEKIDEGVNKEVATV